MNKLEQAKAIKIRELKQALSSYIYTFYDKTDQDADKTARETMVNRILTVNSKYTIEELYLKIGQYALSLLSGAIAVKDVISQIPVQELEYWEKLIKIAIRLAWVEMCVDKYKVFKVKILRTNTISDVLSIDKNQLLTILPPYPHDIITQLEYEVLMLLNP